eukprot:1185801-Prorocentrum_minimum.AAC.1
MRSATCVLLCPSRRVALRSAARRAFAYVVRASSGHQHQRDEAPLAPAVRLAPEPPKRRELGGDVAAAVAAVGVRPHRLHHVVQPHEHVVLRHRRQRHPVVAVGVVVGEEHHLRR